ncbi:13048_t:CDS:2 [Funneliformis geosporum]|nr:13048_t:CDS:2 [Funneliformis geosporum]
MRSLDQHHIVNCYGILPELLTKEFISKYGNFNHMKWFRAYRQLRNAGISNETAVEAIFHPHPIEEISPEFKLCIDDILRRIKNMGPAVDSNEAIRCEYISTILHTAVSLLKDLFILPQMTVTGAESSGCDLILQ